MFEQLVVLLSFVFAIALTHILACATDLIQARDRVRFSGLHALWMGIALIMLVENWLALWSLNRVPHWSVPMVLLLFGTAIAQYFTCSTLAMRVPEHGAVDMAGFFERQRRVIFASYAGLYVTAMMENYAFRGLDGLGASAWIAMNGIILVAAVPLAVAGWARSVLLQWCAGLLVAAMALFFLFNFSLPA